MPPITWQSPWSGATLTLPRRCYDGDILDFIAWVREHPERLKRVVRNQQATVGNSRQAHGHDWPLEGLGQGQEWDWPVLLVSGYSEGDEANGAKPALVMQMPAALLGLANKYEYPQLGLTVFTACALFWDNQQAVRIHSWDEVTRFPKVQYDRYLLRQKSGDEAEPRWYMGEVAVAYVIHPGGFVRSIAPVTGFVDLEAWSVVTLSPSGGASGPRKGVRYRVAPYEGCYYPGLVKSDPTCASLEYVLSGYNHWLGAATVWFSSDLAEQEPYRVVTYIDEVNFDTYVRPWSNSHGWYAVWQYIADGYFQRQAALLTPSTELRFIETIDRHAFRAFLWAFPYSVGSWVEGQAGGAQACTPMRALAQYKLDPGSVEVPCSLEEGFRSTFVATPFVGAFDGTLFHSAQVSLDMLLTIRRRP